MPHMNHLHRIALCLSVCVGVIPNVTVDAETVLLKPHKFTVAEGFELERVAGPPLVRRPIHMCFDTDGSLYVTDSSGNTDKAPVQLKDPKHRVLRS